MHLTRSPKDAISAFAYDIPKTLSNSFNLLPTAPRPMHLHIFIGTGMSAGAPRKVGRCNWLNLASLLHATERDLHCHALLHVRQLMVAR
jgi:hypothetical protein